MNLGICDVWHVVRLLSMHTTIRVSGWTQTTYLTVYPANTIYELSFFGKTIAGGSPALADAQRRHSPQHHARSQDTLNMLVARNHSPFTYGWFIATQPHSRPPSHTATPSMLVACNRSPRAVRFQSSCCLFSIFHFCLAFDPSESWSINLSTSRSVIIWS